MEVELIVTSACGLVGLLEMIRRELFSGLMSRFRGCNPVGNESCEINILLKQGVVAVCI